MLQVALELEAEDFLGEPTISGKEDARDVEGMVLDAIYLALRQGTKERGSLRL